MPSAWYGSGAHLKPHPRDPRENPTLVQSYITALSRQNSYLIYTDFLSNVIIILADSLDQLVRFDTINQFIIILKILRLYYDV